MKSKIGIYIKRFKKLNKGQGIVEYGFIIVLIAMALFAAVGTLGQHIFNFFNTLHNRFP